MFVKIGVIFLITNCDCSGIKILEINSIAFDIDELVVESVLKQFVLKFNNLHLLKLHFFDYGCAIDYTESGIPEDILLSTKLI